MIMVNDGGTKSVEMILASLFRFIAKLGIIVVNLFRAVIANPDLSG